MGSNALLFIQLWLECLPNIEFSKKSEPSLNSALTFQQSALTIKLLKDLHKQHLLLLLQLPSRKGKLIPRQERSKQACFCASQGRTLS